MITRTTTALILAASTSALAEPVHGNKGWLHQHQDLLIDAAMIATACLFAVVLVRGLWKLVSRPQ